jgi:hypothetical protein
MPPEISCGRLDSAAVRLDQRQRLHGALAQLRLRFGLAEHALDAQVDVLVAGQPRQQRVVLEHHRALRRRPGDFAISAQQHAVGRFQQAGDQVQQRRFAAAGVADQGDEFALAHRQIDFTQRVEDALLGVEDHLHAFDIDEFRIVHDSAP